MDEKVYKIVIVDDEPDILEFLNYNLTKQKYQVFTADNGLDGLHLIKKVVPHLIIIDVMMPKMNGIELCEAIRALKDFKTTPIAFLTARAEDEMQIQGLNSGADDYITKPIKIEILLSRIQALLRRNQVLLNNDDILTIGKFVLDPNQVLVFTGSKTIELARKEFRLLYLLASKPGRVFKREEILEHVWGSEVIVGDRTVDVHIRKIREKLGEELIKTVKGIGYKLEF